MFDSNEVLLDPSILVAENTDTNLGQHTLDEYTGDEQGFDVYVPASFADVVEDCNAYREDSTFELFLGNISTRAGIRDFDELRALVANGSVRRFAARDADRGMDVEYGVVHERLTDAHPPEARGALADVLYDEFVFLLERSWVASRLKRPLVKLVEVDTGVHRVEFGADAVRDLLGADDDPVTTRLRSLERRAGWEWAGVGGRASTLLGDHPFAETIAEMGRARDALVLVFDA